MNDPNQITYFGETDFRNKKTKFGIKAKDRTRHVYVIGKTGMGKSTLLENMAAQDLMNGNGIAFIDPHGSAVETLLDYIPEDRIDDVVYFSPADVDNPIAFNVMEDVGPEKRHLVAQGLLSSFKKIWGEETFSDRMEHITSNTLLALLEYPNSTMLSIPRIFTDKDFQKDVIKHITDPAVKNFWVKEFGTWDDRYKKEAYAAVLNKVGQFTSNPLIRNIVGQSKSSFDFRKLMDERKILLVNLSIGQIGESNANLLGSMMSTKIFLAAMSRADANKAELEKLPNFYLFIDEFQNLANDSFADILAQARKYKLNLTMAHQYVEQMPDTVRAAVFGNVGTMIVFRIGSFDAEMFEKEFSPTFYSDDIVNLGIYQIYLRLMIDGIGSSPFSAVTIAPIEPPAVSFRNEIYEASRKNFSRTKIDAEKEINDWNDKTFTEVKQKTDNKNTGTSNSFKPNNNQKSFKPKDSGDRNSNPTALEGQGNNLKKYSDNNNNNNNNLKRPTLEGKSSLKEALDGVIKETVLIPQNKQGKKQVMIEQNRLNKEIESANKDKLKKALQGAMNEHKEISDPSQDTLDIPTEIKAEQTEEKPSYFEDKNINIPPKEVPEDVLRGILKDE